MSDSVSGAPPEITVLLPTYQMESYVGEAVQSVLSSTFRDLELLVVDDGSTDGTATRLGKWVDPGSSDYDPRLRYERQLNSGKSVALNRGLDLARGRWLTIIDADDLFLPDGLARRHALAVRRESGREADVVIGGFEVLESGERRGRRLPLKAPPDVLVNRLCFGWRTPHSLNGCLIRMEVIRATGLFDPRLRRSMDLDYSIRMLQIVRDVRVLDEVVFQYRKHRSTFRQRLRFRKGTAVCRVRLLWKNLRGPRRVAAVSWGLTMDMVKALYEARGNWGQ